MLGKRHPDDSIYAPKRQCIDHTECGTQTARLEAKLAMMVETRDATWRIHKELTDRSEEKIKKLREDISKLKQAQEASQTTIFKAKETNKRLKQIQKDLEEALAQQMTDGEEKQVEINRLTATNSDLLTTMSTRETDWEAQVQNLTFQHGYLLQMIQSLSDQLADKDAQLSVQQEQQWRGLPEDRPIGKEDELFPPVETFAWCPWDPNPAPYVPPAVVADQPQDVTETPESLPPKGSEVIAFQDVSQPIHVSDYPAVAPCTNIPNVANEKSFTNPKLLAYILALQQLCTTFGGQPPKIVSETLQIFEEWNSNWYYGNLGVETATEVGELTTKHQSARALAITQNAQFRNWLTDQKLLATFRGYFTGPARKGRSHKK
jgi:hypothetical protein